MLMVEYPVIITLYLFMYIIMYIFTFVSVMVQHIHKYIKKKVIMLDGKFSILCKFKLWQSMFFFHVGGYLSI